MKIPDHRRAGLHRRTAGTPAKSRNKLRLSPGRHPAWASRARQPMPWGIKGLDNPTSQSIMPKIGNRSWSRMGKEGKTKKVVINKLKKAVCVCWKMALTKFFVCVTKLCVRQSCACDKVVRERWCATKLCVCVTKLRVRQSCACDEVVRERWCVTKLCVCVTKLCVTKMCPCVWQSCVCKMVCDRDGVWQSCVWVCDKVVCVCDTVACVCVCD